MSDLQGPNSGVVGRVIRRLLVDPGVSDLALAGLLVLVALFGAVLDPVNRNFWLGGPTAAAAPFALSGLLLRLPYRGTVIAAATLHGVLLVLLTPLLVWCGLLMLTVIMAGVAIALGAPTALLAAHSVWVLVRTKRWLRARAVSA